MTPPGCVLDFERPLVELELRLAHLRAAGGDGPALAPQLALLEQQVDGLRRDTFSRLTRWQVVQLARHPCRPSPLDYLQRLAPDLVELKGDRAFADDPAIIGGPATLGGRAVMLVAHARGRDPAEQEAHHFGMPRPEGLRKAIRLYRLADRLGLPICTLIDTPGADPGAEAEERGQAMVIAEALATLAEVRPPVVACLVGEGGSGGALALSVADRLLMQEYAVFPVIAPEACSAILYRDGAHAAQSAESLQPTARDLLRLQLVDELVPEPPGGAHRDAAAAARLLGEAIARALDALAAQAPAGRLARRYARLRSYGSVAYAP